MLRNGLLKHASPGAGDGPPSCRHRILSHQARVAAADLLRLMLRSATAALRCSTRSICCVCSRPPMRSRSAPRSLMVELDRRLATRSRALRTNCTLRGPRRRACALSTAVRRASRCCRRRAARPASHGACGAPRGARVAKSGSERRAMMPIGAPNPLRRLAAPLAAARCSAAL